MKFLITSCFLMFFIGCSLATYPDCIAPPADPALFEKGGCGNIFAYQLLDKDRALTVTIDRNIIDLNENCKVFSLQDKTETIRVNLEVAGNESGTIYFNYCSDVLDPDAQYGQPDIWTGNEGKITVSISKEGINIDDKNIYELFYQVSLHIEDLHLLDEDSENEIMEMPE